MNTCHLLWLWRYLISIHLSPSPLPILLQTLIHSILGLLLGSPNLSFLFVRDVTLLIPSHFTAWTISLKCKLDYCTPLLETVNCNSLHFEESIWNKTPYTAPESCTLGCLTCTASLIPFVSKQSNVHIGLLAVPCKSFVSFHSKSVP